MTERIFTIGHSTRDLADFIALLRENGVQRLADIRRYPGSRRYPHFSRDALRLSLPAEGIEYIHMPELGGRRKPLPDSRNTAWRNEQFRAYADYMASDEFAVGVNDLSVLAEARPAAIMCAESVWWRCHRRLLADHLVLVSKVHVEHLFHDGRLVEHTPTAEARRIDDHVVYDLIR